MTLDEPLSAVSEVVLEALQIRPCSLGHTHEILAPTMLSVVASMVAPKNVAPRAGLPMSETNVLSWREDGRCAGMSF